MRDNQGVPNLGAAPREYDSQYFNKAFRMLEIYLQSINAPGPLMVSRINISSLPTDDTGLVVGDVWNDGGVLKVVEPAP